MAEASEKRAIIPKDIVNLLTFALGMAAFWAGGHASQLLPVMHNGFLRTAAGLTVTIGIYVLGIVIITFIATRRLKSILAAAVVAVGLGLASAQIISRLASGLIHDKFDLGILTFVLYLVYGGIYVLCLVVARKFAK